MSEEKGEYITDALEMLGKGYDHSAPPREVRSTISGYTVAPDALSEKYGYVTSLVWGRVWRFCQMSDGVCRAKLEKIADSLGMSERTIIRHLDVLVEGGYFKDMTPDLKNKPHIYADTGKIKIAFSSDVVVSTMTESQRAMTESQRQGDRESVEDSIKRELNINHGDENPKPKPAKKKDLVDGFWELSRGPGVKKANRLNAIASEIKIRTGVEPSGKEGQSFCEFVDNRQQADKQSLTVFLDFIIAEPGYNITFWPWVKMREHWGRAFTEPKIVIQPTEERPPLPAGWLKQYEVRNATR
jgi:DNA-binding Lrp family transcriptional regulator